MIPTRWSRSLRLGFSTTSILLILSAEGSVALAQEVVGAVGAANASPTATTPNKGRRNLKPGDDVFFKDRIATGSGSSAQITFLDRSTLNVGENSEIVIDEFVYRPGAAGTMRAKLNRGMMRYVGGDISHGGGASVQTPVVTIGIRGGIGLIGYIKDAAAIAAVPGVPRDFKGGTIVINTYGTMTVRNLASETVIRRPGFAVFVETSGQAIATPVRLDASSVQALMKTIGSRKEQHGGASATAHRKALAVTSTLGPTLNVPAPIAAVPTINGLDYTATFNAGNAFARVQSQARQAVQLQLQLNAVMRATAAPSPAMTPGIATTTPTTPVTTTPVATAVTPTPVATSVATTPVATPVATTPVATAVATTPVVTIPVATTPVATPVATAPVVTTPVATTPVATPVTTAPVVTTPVATTPVATPVTTAPVVTTPVAATPVVTPVTTAPVVTTPVATTPVATPVTATPVATTPVATTPVATPIATTSGATIIVTTPIGTIIVTTPTATNPTAATITTKPVTVPVTTTSVATAGHDNGKGNNYTNNGHGNGGFKSDK